MEVVSVREHQRLKKVTLNKKSQAITKQDGKIQSFEWAGQARITCAGGDTDYDEDDDNNRLLCV